METAVFLALLILYVTIICAAGLLGERRNAGNNVVSSFFLSGRRLTPLANSLSACVSDFSGFVLLVLPAIAFSSVSGIKNAIFLSVAVAVGGFLSWIFLSRRLRVYAEVAGALTIPEYLEVRFKSASGVVRVVSAGVGIVFSLLMAVFLVSFSSSLCTALFGFSRPLSVAVCLLCVVIYLLFGGFTSVVVSGVVQSVLVVMVLVAAVVLTYLVSGQTQVSIVHSNLLQGLHLFPKTLTDDFYQLSVPSALTCLSAGLCCFGVPQVLTHYMAARQRKKMRRSSYACLIWMIICCGCAVLLGAFSYPLVGSSGRSAALFQGIFIIENEYIRGLLFFVLLVCLLSAAGAYLMSAATFSAYDIYPKIRTKTSEIGMVTVCRIVLVLFAVAVGIMCWDSKTATPVVAVVAMEGFAAAFGPVMLFSLYSGRITHKGAVGSILAGGIGVLAWKALFYWGLGVRTLSFYELVPAFVLSSVVLWGISLVDKKKERKDVALEFDRVCTILKCKGQYRVK